MINFLKDFSVSSFEWSKVCELFSGFYTPMNLVVNIIMNLVNKVIILSERQENHLGVDSLKVVKYILHFIMSSKFIKDIFYSK